MNAQNTLHVLPGGRSWHHRAGRRITFQLLVMVDFAEQNQRIKWNPVIGIESVSNNFIKKQVSQNNISAWLPIEENSCVKKGDTVRVHFYINVSCKNHQHFGQPGPSLEQHNSEMLFFWSGKWNLNLLTNEELLAIGCRHPPKLTNFGILRLTSLWWPRVKVSQQSQSQDL